MERRTRSDTDQKKPITRDNGSLPLGRRTFLRGAGAAAASLAATGIFGGVASAATERHGISFDEEVNVVDDCGADPTGETPADDAIAQAIGSGRLVRFPAGDYTITQGHKLKQGSTVGLLAEEDVTLTVPSGNSFRFLDTSTDSSAPDQVLFEGFDIDIQAEDAVTGLRLNTQRGMHVEDVEYVGRGTYSSGELPNALDATVAEPEATGTVKKFVATKGSAWARYKGGNGRVGIGVFRPNRGTIKVIDCHLEEFGNNGMYAGRHPGNVQIEGGLFRNNNVAQVRISGKGSYVEDATIAIDPAKYTGPRESEYESKAFHMRGVWLEAKNNGGKPAAAAVRNCKINIQDNPAPGAAIDVNFSAKGVNVSGTDIVYEPSSVSPIAGENAQTTNVDIRTP